MRKLTIYILMLFSSAGLSLAGTADIDGLLEVSWAAPLYGEQVDHYLWSYTINGVEDSVSGSNFEPNRADNSVQLENLGDWAVFAIQSVSIYDDTSAVAFSDTVYYSLSLDIEDDIQDILPSSFTLQAYPNPVAISSFSLNWNIKKADRYNIAIYDLLGRKVKQVVDQGLIVGEYVRSIENSFAPGIYFAVIANSDSRRVVKLSILGR